VGVLTLKPIDPERPPDGLVLDARLRGVAIYWPDPAAPPVKRRRKATLAPTWYVQRGGAGPLRPPGLRRGGVPAPDPIRLSERPECQSRMLVMVLSVLASM
jgi:hypothetical protein